WIRLEPRDQAAWSPNERRNASARDTRSGSGPNSLEYSSGVTVWPDATSAARLAAWRDLSEKFSTTSVPAPAGPMLVALEIAWASVIGRGLALAVEAAGRAVGPVAPHAVSASATSIGVAARDANFTGQ